MEIVSIKEKKEFDKVFKSGERYSAKYLTLIRFKESKGNKLYLGIIVKAKHGNAVKRNRTKRIVRETIRSIKTQIVGSENIIIMPKYEATKGFYENAADDLLNLLKISGII